MSRRPKAATRPPLLPEVEAKRQDLKAAHETQYWVLLGEDDVQALAAGSITPYVRHQAARMLELETLGPEDRS